MITVQQLCKAYGQRQAVNQVSFTVEEGQTLVLLGTSGSGKTTTLRTINRLVEPDAGSIFIGGKNIRTQPVETLRRGIGYVLQDHGLFPHYTVAENIALVPSLLRWPEEKTRWRVDSLLEKLHLPPDRFRNVYPATLSGGQRQRVGLARALAADPPVLLMDEPFGALDPLTRMAVRKEFGELDELQKKTIVLVTHDVQEAVALGDRIGLMNQGELQQLGRPAELLLHPANDFVRQFFDHQRLQLEWQCLTLAEVWPFLPPADKPTDLGLTINHTLWEAVTLLAQQRTTLSVTHPADGRARLLDFAILQQAIQQQKT